MPVLSVSRCTPFVVGCAPILTEGCFWRRLSVLKSVARLSSLVNSRRFYAISIA